ncbi:MAG: NAD(P)/FAD-dependent oxidoreductase [Candidatus Thermoplasmatota archaeon]|jgi:sulfide:quinone oxidoreductase|nr:NAD(P)/FAD-dependent oxidoreductase [Candidatus Thermoplasmatota archaeon]MCL5785591.1 NAD(P)/FAD-dependent oxidoreductase [Candidatus Thermoplasmatota archaeon]
MSPSAKKVLILGDGAAGTMMGNKLRFHSDPSDIQITVLGNSEKHYFKPDGVSIPFGFKDYRNSVKPTRSLFNFGVNYVRETVASIDVKNSTVIASSGKSYFYDYLIIATGDRFAYEDLPGYEKAASHFYSLEASLALREKLNHFNGGKIVIGQASIPIQCPPAPYEFTFQLEQYLNLRGIRKQTELHYIYPLNRVFTIPNVAPFVEKLMDDKGIIIHKMFNVDSVEPEIRRLNSIEGETLDYDLLVLVPPHRGQKVITESGLADESGYIDVDRNRLNYADYDNVFVIGDATNLPISKAGATAHFETEYLANRLANEVNGNAFFESYGGEVACTTITSGSRAITLFFSYNKPPRVNYESKSDYFLKWTSSDTYFTGMIRGIM